MTAGILAVVGVLVSGAAQPSGQEPPKQHVMRIFNGNEGTAYQFDAKGQITSNQAIRLNNQLPVRNPADEGSPDMGTPAYYRYLAKQPGGLRFATRPLNLGPDARIAASLNGGLPPPVDPAYWWWGCCYWCW